MKEEDVIKYPKLKYLHESSYGGRELLGKLLYWEAKEDGSNIRVFLDEQDEIHFGSRNLLTASDDLLKSIHNTGYVNTLKEALLTQKYQWHGEIIIFFELLQKGKSPTRIEYHEKDDLVVFDIYSLKYGWWSYPKVYQFCYQWKLPMVSLWSVTSHSTIERLEQQIDKMLEVAKNKNKEGVVFKSYEDGKGTFFKARIDVPDFKEVEVNIEKDSPQYPELPKAEIMNEIQKVLEELGPQQFKDKKVAMPLIAQYVSAECKARYCSVPKKLYSYYLEKLSELN
ncbi:MAG: hypothetical protein QIT36_gp004 [Methanophagales virus GBV301]|uniref:RNA ligase domain-containing protein n=1 Tax=Methanophagales virus GBV301 TaxID=2999280 RepID=A0A9E9A5N3_9CAUD|nr:MAG: hypothetical protein QIT36_gp004 [Methanophagales virus GBV301]WAE39428.1 MAG: hypothetical protein LDLAKGPJ_00004 [Methanophagales virus GBV301]